MIRALLIAGTMLLSGFAQAETLKIADGFVGNFLKVVNKNYPSPGAGYRYEVFSNSQKQDVLMQFHFYIPVDGGAVCNFPKHLPGDVLKGSTNKGETVYKVVTLPFPITTAGCLGDIDEITWVHIATEPENVLGGYPAYSYTLPSGQSLVLVVPDDAKIKYQSGLGKNMKTGEVLP